MFQFVVKIFHPLPYSLIVNRLPIEYCDIDVTNNNKVINASISNQYKDYIPIMLKKKTQTVHSRLLPESDKAKNQLEIDEMDVI